MKNPFLLNFIKAYFRITGTSSCEYNQTGKVKISEQKTARLK